MLVSIWMLARPRVSTAPPCGHCACCTIQDLHIWELTTTRVHGTQPRVSCMLLFVFFFLESLSGAQSQALVARPRASLLICCFWSWGEVRRVDMMYQLSFFCIYAGFCR
ncbi:hypothetical protein Hanom_Chr10g00946061 [Helianthus anomalus]